EARKVIDDMVRRDPSLEAQAGYLDGRLLMGKEDWLGACKKFERIVPLLLRAAESAELTKQAYVSIGACYARLGYTDQQLAAFRQAVKLDAKWAPARAGLGSALAATGRLDEAIENYRALSGSGSVDTRLDLASLLIARNLRLPERDWREAE